MSDKDLRMQGGFDLVFCQGCQKRITEGTIKMVGPKPYCAKCYEELDESEKQGQDVAATTTGMDTGEKKPKEIPEPVKCDTCGRPVGEGAHKLGGKPQCPECYYKLKDTVREPAVTEDIPAPIGGKPISSPAEPTDSSKDRVNVSYSGPEGGEDLPPSGVKATPPAEKAPSPEPSTTSQVPKLNVHQCEACDRPLQEGVYKIADGFYLCTPCFHGSRDTAVSICRKKHQAKLDELRRKYEV